MSGGSANADIWDGLVTFIDETSSEDLGKLYLKLTKLSLAATKLSLGWPVGCGDLCLRAFPEAHVRRNMDFDSYFGVENARVKVRVETTPGRDDASLGERFLKVMLDQKWAFVTGRTTSSSSPSSTPQLTKLRPLCLMWDHTHDCVVGILLQFGNATTCEELISKLPGIDVSLDHVDSPPLSDPVDLDVPPPTPAVSPPRSSFDDETLQILGPATPWHQQPEEVENSESAPPSQPPPRYSFRTPFLPSTTGQQAPLTQCSSAAAAGVRNPVGISTSVNVSSRMPAPALQRPPSNYIARDPARQMGRYRMGTAAVRTPATTGHFQQQQLFDSTLENVYFQREQQQMRQQLQQQQYERQLQQMQQQQFQRQQQQNQTPIYGGQQFPEGSQLGGPPQTLQQWSGPAATAGNAAHTVVQHPHERMQQALLGQNSLLRQHRPTYNFHLQAVPMPSTCQTVNLGNQHSVVQQQQCLPGTPLASRQEQDGEFRGKRTQRQQLLHEKIESLLYKYKELSKLVREKQSENAARNRVADDESEVIRINYHQMISGTVSEGWQQRNMSFLLAFHRQAGWLYNELVEKWNSGQVAGEDLNVTGMYTALREWIIRQRNPQALLQGQASHVDPALSRKAGCTERGSEEPVPGPSRSSNDQPILSPEQSTSVAPSGDRSSNPSQPVINPDPPPAPPPPLPPAPGSTGGGSSLGRMLKGALVSSMSRIRQQPTPPAAAAASSASQEEVSQRILPLPSSSHDAVPDLSVITPSSSSIATDPAATTGNTGDNSADSHAGLIDSVSHILELSESVSAGTSREENKTKEPKKPLSVSSSPQLPSSAQSLSTPPPYAPQTSTSHLLLPTLSPTNLRRVNPVTLPKHVLPSGPLRFFFCQPFKVLPLWKQTELVYNMVCLRDSQEQVFLIFTNISWPGNMPQNHPVRADSHGTRVAISCTTLGGPFKLTTEAPYAFADFQRYFLHSEGNSLYSTFFHGRVLFQLTQEYERLYFQSFLPMEYIVTPDPQLDQILDKTFGVGDKSKPGVNEYRKRMAVSFHEPVSRTSSSQYSIVVTNRQVFFFASGRGSYDKHLEDALDAKVFGDSVEVRRSKGAEKIMKLYIFDERLRRVYVISGEFISDKDPPIKLKNFVHQKKSFSFVRGHLFRLLQAKLPFHGEVVNLASSQFVMKRHVNFLARSIVRHGKRNVEFIAVYLREVDAQEGEEVIFVANSDVEMEGRNANVILMPVPSEQVERFKNLWIDKVLYVQYVGERSWKIYVGDQWNHVSSIAEADPLGVRNSAFTNNKCSILTNIKTMDVLLKHKARGEQQRLPVVQRWEILFGPIVVFDTVHPNLVNENRATLTFGRDVILASRPTPPTATPPQPVEGPASTLPASSLGRSPSKQSPTFIHQPAVLSSLTSSQSRIPDLSGHAILKGLVTEGSSSISKPSPPKSVRAPSERPAEVSKMPPAMCKSKTTTPKEQRAAENKKCSNPVDRYSDLSPKLRRIALSCSRCDKSYTYFNQFKLGCLATCHDSTFDAAELSTPVHCSACQVTFKNYVDYCEHVDEEELPDDQQMRCLKCNDTFASVCTLFEHGCKDPEFPSEEDCPSGSRSENENQSRSLLDRDSQADGPGGTTVHEGPHHRSPRQEIDAGNEASSSSSSDYEEMQVTFDKNIHPRAGCQVSDTLGAVGAETPSPFLSPLKTTVTVTEVVAPRTAPLQQQQPPMVTIYTNNLEEVMDAAATNSNKPSDNAIENQSGEASVQRSAPGPSMSSFLRARIAGLRGAQSNNNNTVSSVIDALKVGGPKLRVVIPEAERRLADQELRDLYERTGQLTLRQALDGHPKFISQPADDDRHDKEDFFSEPPPKPQPTSVSQERHQCNVCLMYFPSLDDHDKHQDLMHMTPMTSRNVFSRRTCERKKTVRGPNMTAFFLDRSKSVKGVTNGSSPGASGNVSGDEAMEEEEANNKEEMIPEEATQQDDASSTSSSSVTDAANSASPLVPPAAARVSESLSATRVSSKFFMCPDCEPVRLLRDQEACREHALQRVHYKMDVLTSGDVDILDDGKLFLLPKVTISWEDMQVD